MFGLAALVCIVLGFIVGIAEVKIVFAPLAWFVAALAFNTLSVAVPKFGGKE
jgi:hypothetical protein